MLGLMVLAFATPFLVTGGFDGRDEQPIALATSLASGVQVFWLASSYLLLSPKLKRTKIVLAAMLMLLCTALSVFLFIQTGSTSGALEQYTGPVLIAAVTLYFITITLVADRIAKTSLGTIGYAFLIFYWPLALFIFAPRLREAFRLAEEKRSEAARV